MDADLDLQILKAGERYRINVLKSPAGEADGEFALPFTEEEIGHLFRGLGHVRKATRGAASPEVAKAREFGTQLFDKVFSGDVRDCLSDSRGRARAAGTPLRIRLRLTRVPELLDLPWELLYDRRQGRFVALDSGTTLVRHLPVPEPVLPMRVDPPLRILVAISNPRGDLNVDQEWQNLSAALTGLQKDGLVQVERLAPATFEGVQAALSAGPVHILHFIGHGHYEPADENGYLAFEKQPSGERRVGAARLADLLRPHRALRLVVLNACEGGRTSRSDPFAGVAQSLVQSAIPAVVAMQFPVTDLAAISFAGAFYGGIASGAPVDLALAQARREVNLKGEEGDIEWATPVLYMRSDGALFDIAERHGATSLAQSGASHLQPAHVAGAEGSAPPGYLRRALIAGGLVLALAAVGVLNYWEGQRKAEAPAVPGAPDAPSQAVEPSKTNPEVLAMARKILGNLDKTRNTGREFDYWPNGGIRIAYDHVASLATYAALAKLSPYPVFLSGPHGEQELRLTSKYTFGHYNPAFLTWLELHLQEITGDRAFIESTKPLFRKFLGSTAMAYWDTLVGLEGHPAERDRLLKDYKSRIDKRDLPEGYYYNIAWSEAEEKFPFLKELNKVHDSNVVAPAVYFWLRRDIDQTKPLFAALLEQLLDAYGMISRTPNLYYDPRSLPRVR